MMQSRVQMMCRKPYLSPDLVTLISLVKKVSFFRGRETEEVKKNFRR